MITLKLTNINWDLSLDAAGNIRTTDGLGAIAQTVANKIQLFKKDAYLAQDRGINHFVVDLGRNLPLSLAQHEFRKAALETEGVKDATVSIEKNRDRRTITGEITITSTSGETATVKV